MAKHGLKKKLQAWFPFNFYNNVMRYSLLSPF